MAIVGSMLQALLVLIFIATSPIYGGPEEEEGVKYADRCEACKILATELQARLTETGKSHDVIELGYSVDDVKPKKRTEYRRSELRLLETLENVCERILQYNIHKERKDSTRFAKGMSQTFQTLHGLVDKGVKVDLGIPYELWDKPSAEITQMKTQCETLIEGYEDVIEKWYFEKQDQKPLIEYLCVDNVLRNKNHQCLYEELDDAKKKTKNKKAKAAKEEL
ncbi:protein canopy homolog 4 [Anopheles ziemanni]|uniref:protein canopy homolog 4 n=1 Tax=Anopheles coustani TaxID=139045 RepID=UPI00265A1793|nr:protein canopy homolog 4 [Anopheles coustani]XP_058173879.1 protein canopy homolog 4 [Anopheles ziemanni]